MGNTHHEQLKRSAAPRMSANVCKSSTGAELGGHKKAIVHGLIHNTESMNEEDLLYMTLK